MDICRARVKILIITMPAIMICAACAYFSISGRDDAKERRVTYSDNQKRVLYNSCVITGRVLGGMKNPHAVMVIAHPLSFKIKSAEDYVILERPGPFMLYLPEGDYHVYALCDFNNNGIFEEREVAGVFGGPDPVRLKTGDAKSGIVIEAGERANDALRFPRRVNIKDDASTVTYQMKNGQVAKIYDVRFCPENARAGWWTPSQFMKAFGANIYFTAEYDTRKIPVLFIHGAEGSPQNWAYFYFRMNSERYQSWFFYYPSGIRLSLATSLLYERLLDLKERYGFSSICITAHSMGGLLARSLLTRYDLRGKGIDVKVLVTLASPWTGFESADFAQKYSSRSLPSWIDLASQSSFIKRTLRAPLPKATRYHLFFGKQDELSKGKALDERAFRDACGKYGFDVDHDTILVDWSVFKKYREVLDREF